MAIGLYGVTAYTVARRSSEIGIRIALGARPGQVVGMVMRGAMVQTLIGLAIGIPVVLACARYVESQLFEIKGVDWRVMLTAVGALAFASLLAGLIPARRAAATDPARTLSIGSRGRYVFLLSVRSFVRSCATDRSTDKMSVPHNPPYRAIHAARETECVARIEADISTRTTVLRRFEWHAYCLWDFRP